MGNAGCKSELCVQQPAKSAEASTEASEVCATKPVFFDMKHSNNAARVRLWLRLKGLTEEIETRTITYADLQDPEYAQVNPLKKVPAYRTEDGTALFESFVILEYLEEKYDGQGALSNFKLGSCEERAYVQLLIRVHDIYIASPNCTQPGFAHTQGCMYLAPHETEFCAAVRCMDRATRAAKLAEIWKQLCWLEQHCKGPYLAGNSITLADLTWYPTTIFMEFMLPRVYQWTSPFHDETNFPRLTAWHASLSANPVFKQVRAEIWEFWEQKHAAGQFEAILPETEDETFKWKYP